MVVPVVDRYYTYVGPSPIRWADDITPAHDSALLCGLNAHNAEMVVPANPGSNISFHWVGSGGTNVCTHLVIVSLILIPLSGHIK